MKNRVFDVAIIGAGPSGSTLALGLARCGLDVALIDARDSGTPARPDGRNFAIVTGNWSLLHHVGITDDLAGVSQPLNGLEAVDGGTHWFGAPSVLFTSADLDSADPDETLGWMVRAEDLQARLDAALAGTPAITHFRATRFEALNHAPGCVTLALSAARKIKARLLVGADGVNSPVRQALGIGVVGRDYGKSVFTANVRLSVPHEGIARQLFTPEGPFAILPLPGQRANLAWYMKRGAAETLAAMPSADTEAELNARFADFAGQMTIDGGAGSYPLILQLAAEMIGPRAVLVGDAARRVNPLAGQGLNQGFKDVGALIETLREADTRGEDIGSPQVLEAYSQARRFDATSTALALDGIDRLFSNDSMWLKPIRTIGLAAARHLDPLRKLLTRKASATEGGAPNPGRAW